MQNRGNSAHRASAWLALVVAGVSFSAWGLGLFPDSRAEEVRARVALSETVAVPCSLLAAEGRLAIVERDMEMLRARRADVQSLGLRRADGALLASAGPHEDLWRRQGPASHDGCVIVPIHSGAEVWGQLEVLFHPLYPESWQRLLDPALLGFLAFAVPVCGVVFWLLLRRTARPAHPFHVVPQRIRQALDTLSEGLVLLDKDERVIVANRAFASAIGLGVEKLLGRRLGDLPWQAAEADRSLSYPWRKAIERMQSQRGVSLGFGAAGEARRLFMVNASLLSDDDGRFFGVLASFNDVTRAQEHRGQLMRLLSALEQSRDEVREQNDELRFLATRDPLTGCCNRRTFFEQFETHWANTVERGRPLSCLIVDIDFFKAINDTHGHSVGDDVLRQVGQCLNLHVPDGDLVCRYGGEEFCLLLPELNLDQAFQIAERIRLAIAGLSFPQLGLTASVGVSCSRLGATGPQALLEEADRSLYAAKRSGRNKSVRFDRLPEELPTEPQPAAAVATGESPIPYPAVAALVSALSYRDAETAAHSSRVADLAAMLARDRLGTNDAYVVEVAALLHDIGKIGVPDAILLKSGRLSAEEWQIMEMHDRFGVEIVNASFHCEALTEIIENHHALYGGDLSKPHLPKGNEIPLGARIIAIADAYDAMVSDRVYRKGRSPEEAFAELQRCSGRQFDPELIERFIALVRASHGNTRQQAGLVSRDTALSIGLQVEALLKALDGQDLEGMKALLTRLHGTAERFELPQIAAQADEVARLLATEPDLKQLFDATQELLELCRQMHQVALRQARSMVSAAESRE